MKKIYILGLKIVITSKKELNRILKIEKKTYIKSYKDYFKQFITRNEKIEIWKFQKHLRKAEYCYNASNKILRIMFVYHIMRKNILGKRLGIFMQINTIEEGLVIYHSGQIVVSGLSKCGKNLHLHGCNCIGNKGIDGVAPIIGDNCDVGFGAAIIGKINLGNNVTIGANAVVNKNFSEGVIAGIPAKKING